MKIGYYSMKFYIETFGCQMNKNDSELMLASFKEAGFSPALSQFEADIAVFNTCSVRQHAEDRVISRIGSNKKNIRSHNGIIVITGCMAQRIGDELVRSKTADLVIGPYQAPDIGKIVKEYLSNRDKNAYLSQDIENFSRRISINSLESEELSWHKWVTITHGCENYCSYCIVPHVRGKLISFKSDDILNYIKSLTEKGISEITLLGQNVNQYGTDSDDLPFYKLLEKAAEIDGLVRVNFLTSHPKDFSFDIIKVIKDHTNISKSIHIPLQSGSDRILSLMNRKYNMEHYLRIIDRIKNELDEFSITTDLIVGFPCETIGDYEETLKYINLIEFDDAFMYAYSPRENTPAYNLEETLTKNEKTDRLNRLIKIQREISKKKLIARINREEKMIVEKISKKSDKEVMGKTFLNHPVVLPGSSDDIGRDFTIKIEGIKGTTLQGVRIV